MTYDIISGYSGLFRPPFKSLDNRGSCMYCLTTDSKRTLVAIPLTPHFFNDLYNIIEHPQYQKLILVMQSTDCMYISEIYNLFAEVTHNLQKEFQLVCPEVVIIPTSDYFMTKVVHGKHVDITQFGDEHETLAAIVDFNNTMTSPARNVYDIALSLHDKRIYFTQYMSEDKLQWLIEHPHFYTEIHMPFTPVTYGGSAFYELWQKINALPRDERPDIMSKILVNSFRTTEEANWCRQSGFRYGEVIYRDLV